MEPGPTNQLESMDRNRWIRTKQFMKISDHFEPIPDRKDENLIAGMIRSRKIKYLFGLST